MDMAWRSLVDGDEGQNVKEVWDLIVLHEPSLLFRHFINELPYHLGKYKQCDQIKIAKCL